MPLSAQRAAVAAVAGLAGLVLTLGTAYVVASDSSELSPAPAVHLTPEPQP